MKPLLICAHTCIHIETIRSFMETNSSCNLTALYNSYVLIQADKASSNIILISKVYYRFTLLLSCWSFCVLMANTYTITYCATNCRMEPWGDWKVGFTFLHTCNYVPEYPRHVGNEHVPNVRRDQW